MYFVTAENPRTCVAWTYDNHLLLMCVDGRSVNARGMSIYELRDDIYTRGSIRHAFNLDGGGSTEMWARGVGVCNVPSDGHERPVVDAVVIVAAAPSLPAPPANLAATPGTTNVSLSWSLSSGAMSYNLKRSTTDGGPYTIIGNTPATTFTNSGLTSGATYYYVVSALNSIGESLNSSQVSATTLSAPPAPVHLTATAGESRAVLSWDAVPGASTYHVKRSTTDGGPYTVVANVTSPGWTNGGLTSGIIYYYVVSALNAIGESPNSTQVSATPLALPPSPTRLTATPGDGLIILGSDTVPGVLSYRLKRSVTNGGPYAVIANLASTAYTNVGLVNGTTYYYVVSAVNSVGESANSAQAFATPCAIPPAPAGLAATLSNGQFALSWSAVPGAANYLVYRSRGPNGPYTALANLIATNYLDTTFDSAAVSFYVVRAGSGCGVSADSSVVSAPLRLTDRAVVGTNLVMGGWGGVAGQTYYVLGSTNLAAPVIEWTRLLTNTFGPSGGFSFTNAMDPALGQQFYLIQAQP